MQHLLAVRQEEIPAQSSYLVSELLPARQVNKEPTFHGIRKQSWDLRDPSCNCGKQNLEDSAPVDPGSYRTSRSRDCRLKYGDNLVSGIKAGYMRQRFDVKV
jgi:hypothetical protein